MTYFSKGDEEVALPLQQPNGPSRGRWVTQTVEVPPTGCPNLPTGKDRPRIVTRQAYIQNATDLTPEELDQAIAKLWQSRAKDLDAGKPILPPNVCRVCARHIPGHLVECEPALHRPTS